MPPSAFAQIDGDAAAAAAEAEYRCTGARRGISSPAMVRISSSPAATASYLASNLLPKCRSLAAVKQLHAHLLHRASFPYNHFLSKLLSLFTSSSSSSAAAAASDYALLLLASHSAPTAFSYNVAIRFFASSRPHTSLRLFLHMLRSAIRPDSYTLPFLLLAAARYPAPSLARAAHALLGKIGLNGHDHTVHSLITMYSYLDDPGAARKVFDGIPTRDVVSWNAMMKAYGRVGMNGEVGRMFRDMVKEGTVAPNAVTVAVVLAACRDQGDLVLGRWVEEWSWSARMEMDSLVGSALLGMYEKCGEIAEARRVFDTIIDKDIVAWNAMITGYAQNGMSNEAISLFHSMRIAGMRPDKITLAGVLSACSAVGALELGSELDGYASRRGLYSNVYVGTALVDMYAKCGDLDKAIEVFRKMPCKNVASWNALICGLAFNGRGDEAIQHFQLMRNEEGLKPDDITFIGVLSACVHAGLVKDGKRWFNSLTPEFQIIPKIEHYSCMVDLLARTCRKCKNVEIGERVINRIIQLEPTNSWNYVVSSKIYASSDRLDDSAKMRGLMRERGVNKTPGCSWVEVSGKVLEFYAGDEPQHGADDMYQVLNLLVDEMRLEGYVPNLDVEVLPWASVYAAIHCLVSRSLQVGCVLDAKFVSLWLGWHEPEMVKPGSAVQVTKRQNVALKTDTGKVYSGNMDAKWLLMQKWVKLYYFSEASALINSAGLILMLTVSAINCEMHTRKRAATVPATKPARQTPENTPKAAARRDGGTLSAT
uniref:DYW domain-containing protein n=1 Tax=Oryza nivara TaxID=4536 RepID=A0A0E0HCQ4_ORYNI